jgi:hypothetical protein
MITQTTFRGTIHKFNLNGQERVVIDPCSIPSDVRDSLCIQHNYWLPSIIGPNHNVAHFDVGRQGWRDMRYAKLESTYNATVVVTRTPSAISLSACHF